MSMDAPNKIASVCCLKWKAGERKAIQMAGPSIFSSLGFIVKLPTIDAWDHERKCRLDPVEYYKLFGTRFRSVFGKAAAIVDVSNLDDDSFGSTVVEHPVFHLLARLGVCGGRGIPLLRMKSRPVIFDACGRYALRQSLGIAIALTFEDLLNPELAESVDEILDRIHLPAHMCHLVLDLGYRDLRDAAKFAELIIDVINGLPKLQQWKSLTVLCSEVPTNFSRQRTDTVVEYPVRDQDFRSALQARADQCVRMPLVGDYGIDLTEEVVRQGIPRPSLQLRFLCSDPILLVSKAKKSNKGYTDIQKAGELLRNDPRFAATPSTTGSKWMEAIADGLRIGAPSDWRAAGTLHHLQRTAAIYGTKPVKPEIEAEQLALL